MVMNEGPGLMIKEVPPDFEVQHMKGVMLLIIIKKVTRYRSFVSKEILYCCKLWIVSICKLWIDSIYKLWIILQSQQVLSKQVWNICLQVYVASVKIFLSANIYAKVIPSTTFLSCFYKLFLIQMFLQKIFLQVYFY